MGTGSYTTFVFMVDDTFDCYTNNDTTKNLSIHPLYLFTNISVLTLLGLLSCETLPHCVLRILVVI